jgi:hypothetical protein
MSKNKKLLLLGITLVIAGFFIIIFFSSGEEEYVELDFREKNTFEDPENYEFQELEETTLVTNENLGFSFEVPKDWSVSAYEKDGEEFGYLEDIKGITFLSPDYQANESDEIEEGCEIGVIVLSYEQDDSFNNWDQLKKDILYYQENKKDNDWKKFIDINGYYGIGYSLNATAEDWEKEGKKTGEVITQFPSEDKLIYNIGASFPTSNITECQEHFYDLLDSISFTKKND